MSGISLLDILWLLIRENLVFAGAFCICTTMFALFYSFFCGDPRKNRRTDAYVTFAAVASVVEASLAVLLDILVRFFG